MTKDLYSALLRKIADFIENLYGLSTTGSEALPTPPEGVSPARHLAAYLALSSVTCWTYEAPDNTDPSKTVPLFVTKPQKTETVGCFKCFKSKEWMKDVPELTKLYARAMRDDHGWLRRHQISPTPWNLQVGSNSKIGFMLKLAGEFAAHQEIFLKAPSSLVEPDLSEYNFATAYSLAPAAFGVTPVSSQSLA